MKKTTIAAIVLGVLVLVALVQAFQLNGVKAKLESDGLSVSSAGSSAPVAGSGGSGNPQALPSSIKDLPQMVGGC